MTESRQQPVPGAAVPAHRGLGIDVGGTGIKGGIVDLDTGAVIGERRYLETPQPATPDAVAATIVDLVSELGWDGPVGVALPTVIHHGVARVAPNIDDSWIGCDVERLFDRHLPGRAVSVLNDADAAGVAETVYGAAKHVDGLVIVLTFGTGIGSAFLVDGRLVPNTEFGHILVRDVDGTTVDESEHLASATLRQRNGWSFDQWTPHVTRVLSTLEDLLWPQLFVIGGGVSEAADEWFPMLETRTPIVAARARNDAGLVGAAALAASVAGTVDLGRVLAGAH